MSPERISYEAYVQGFFYHLMNMKSRINMHIYIYMYMENLHILSKGNFSIVTKFLK